MLKKIDQFLNKFSQSKSYSKARGTKQTYKSLLSFVQLIIHWEEIVGKKLIEVSLPQRIYKNCLYIVINHPSYAQHLKLLQDEVLAKIFNKFPGFKQEFHEIKFFYSEKVFQEQFTKRKTEVSKLEAKERNLDETFNLHDPKLKELYAIAKDLFKDTDPEYRESFISLYIQNQLNKDNL